MPFAHRFFPVVHTFIHILLNAVAEEVHKAEVEECFGVAFVGEVDEEVVSFVKGFVVVVADGFVKGVQGAILLGRFGMPLNLVAKL